MTAGRYIAIEGPIGVGKTTLARRLAADLAVGLLAENPDDNPFLGDFYDAPGAHALSAQLFFLLQRTEQVESMQRAAAFVDGCVADFMFDKDALFARLTLGSHELALYHRIHERIAGARPCPDRVIYLDAGLDTLWARIARRGRAAERRLTPDYLARVQAAYRAYFRHYTAAPIVHVDAEAQDLVGDPSAYERLRAALDRPETVQYLT